jgi:hypothetical protein
MRRRIAPQPRALMVADDFVCPPELESGWYALREKVREGFDLNPHLSKRHASLLNPDGLLAEWGVHHFHLGITPDSRDPNFVSRTGPLLYALVTDQVFCAINVYSHSSFENCNVLEGIHRNWPEFIARYRVNGTTGFSLTAEQRRTVRKKNANVHIATLDGTVYTSIGGVVMASGVKFEAVQQADYCILQIQGLQTTIEQKLDEILPALKQNGYVDEPEVEATLGGLSSEGIYVFFSKYDVQVNVTANMPPQCAWQE